MRVALDIEGCLDRFYGGYYSGELHFLRSICLMTTTTTMMMLFNRLGLRWTIQSMLWVRAASRERLSIRPNGGHCLLRWNFEGEQETYHGTQRLPTENDFGEAIYWVLVDLMLRWDFLKVLKHIRMIGTPPPKIWWIPPSGLRTCLRNALRTVEIPVVSTKTNIYDSIRSLVGIWSVCAWVLFWFFSISHGSFFITIHNFFNHA